MPDREDRDTDEREARPGGPLRYGDAERVAEHLEDAVRLLEPLEPAYADDAEELIRDAVLRVEDPEEHRRSGDRRRHVGQVVDRAIDAAAAELLEQHVRHDERERHFDRNGDERVGDRRGERLPEGL